LKLILFYIVFYPSAYSLQNHDAVSDDAHRLLQVEVQAAEREVRQGTDQANPTAGIQVQAVRVLGATLQGQDNVISAWFGKHLQIVYVLWELWKWAQSFRSSVCQSVTLSCECSSLRMIIATDLKLGMKTLDKFDHA
jgi:hypothetical protein